MKLAKFALALSAVLMGANAWAGVVSTSSNLTLLALDGQKVRKSTVLQINDNKVHQVVVQASSVVGGSYVESEPMVLTFNGSTEDLQISTAEWRSKSDADHFLKTPVFQVKTQSGNALEYKWDHLKGEGFMPNANVESNLAHYNQSAGVAAVPAFVQAVPMPAVNLKAEQGENVAEKQLHHWFKQADKETQKRFLDWAKKQ